MNKNFDSLFVVIFDIVTQFTLHFSGSKNINFSPGSKMSWASSLLSTQCD